MRKPQKPDRRAEARRRADKLAVQLEAQRIDRFARSPSIGMGPLSFNNAMARRHGWTNAEIASFWEAASTLYVKTSHKVRKRHPELYDLHHSKEPIYIGPDENGKTLKLDKLPDDLK
jgi:hypothetical protein